MSNSEIPAGYEICLRCKGTGRYSFNQMHLDMCYGCMGKGFVAEGTQAKPKIEGARYWITGNANFFLPTNDYNEVPSLIKRAAQLCDERGAKEFEASDRWTGKHVAYEKIEGKWKKTSTRNGYGKGA